MTKRSTTQFKNRLKDLRKNKTFIKQEEETIQDKIDKINSYIKCCESDLKNPAFSNNINIKHKIELMQKQIEELEKSKIQNVI